MTLVERLREIALFAELDDEQLAWLAEVGSRVELADGEVLFHDGEPARFFYVLLGGELLITRIVDGKEELFSRHSARIGADQQLDDKPRAANQFTGEMPLLCDGVYVAKATAHGPTELMAYEKETFLEMVARFPQICRVLLPVLAWRIRSYEAKAGRNAMLEGLGTLAAGLAHELNNPAAAVVRAAGELRGAVQELAERAAGWCSLPSPRERCLLQRARDLLPDLSGTLPARGPRDELAAADAADLVIDWLAGRGVSRAAEFGVTLVDHGFDLDTLTELSEGMGDEMLDRSIGCLSYCLLTNTLVEEVSQAGRRIEALIRDAKAYTNLDRAPERDVDLREGLDATLTMQGPKLAGIRVHRDYADLPTIVAYPSELNQVWTNLIENAVDAMGDRGELRIAAWPEADHVVVEIRDSGPGIPPERLSLLFQPFYTTKDVGRGTGLGLHLSHDIVTHRHHGSIEVASIPGDTRFRVRLPVNDCQA
ncbi:MAG TPA: ATP-binding protein [Streptosporangiaceae bacterium]|nr:ATP-binding protein [Streptosporangiaceae bacterium]